MSAHKSTDRTNSSESQVRFLATFEDLVHLIHAVIWDGPFDMFDEADYASAAAISRRVRATHPGDQTWPGARIAAFRAEGLDPSRDFATEIERDPTLDPHAILYGGWPKPYMSYEVDERPALTRGGILFYTLMYHHQTRHPSDVEEGRYHTSVQFAIRGVIGLLGQAGLDEILIDDSVQAVLRSTPQDEFGPGGTFPTISLSR